MKGIHFQNELEMLASGRDMCVREEGGELKIFRCLQCNEKRGRGKNIIYYSCWKNMYICQNIFRLVFLN